MKKMWFDWQAWCVGGCPSQNSGILQANGMDLSLSKQHNWGLKRCMLRLKDNPRNKHRWPYDLVAEVHSSFVNTIDAAYQPVSPHLHFGRRLILYFDEQVHSFWSLVTLAISSTKFAITIHDDRSCILMANYIDFFAHISSHCSIHFPTYHPIVFQLSL